MDDFSAEIRFKELEKTFESLSSPGIRPGLERLSILLPLLGNPQDKFKAVHIVGTNGKGSAAASLTSILKESLYSTALYTSPHLVSFGERLEIDGKRVPVGRWESAAAEIKSVIESNDLLLHDRPTYFELITAAAFMITANANVDIAVVEAGLGGRLDATNTMGNVILTLITSIGMDHTDFLGDTIEKVASEKFAVLREDRKAIFSGGESEVEKLFFDFAHKMSAEPVLLRELCKADKISTSLKGTDFTLTLSGGYKLQLQTPLSGAYQADNTSLAVAGALVLKDNFDRITYNTIIKGISEVSWPGRLETVAEKPIIALDGAHNPNAMKRLTETLLTIYGAGKTNFVLAIMGDKDVKGMLSLIKPLDPLIFCCEVPGMKRSLGAEELCKLCSAAGLRTAGFWESPAAAIGKARANGKDTVCCGSLYFVGWIKENVRFK